MMPIYPTEPSTAPIPPHGNFHWLQELRLPRTAAAVREVAGNTQAPYGLAVMSALTAQSLALQGLVNVELPIGKESPVSVTTLAVAESGERKTAVGNAFIEPVRRYQQRFSVVHKKLDREWQSQYDVWFGAVKTKKRQISRLRAQMTDVSLVEQELEVLLEEEPPKPRAFKLLYENTTVEALLYSMHQNYKYAGLVSSEGGSLLKGHVFRDLALLNNLSDGGDCLVERRNTESYRIDGGRMTLSLMLQPKVLQAHMEEKGEEFRGVGFLARSLCFHPLTTQGSRFEYGSRKEWKSLDAFSARTEELLDLARVEMDLDEVSRRVIRFSNEAKIYYLAVSNSIEQEIRVGGRFEGLNDLASKLAENIGRVAALLHCFEFGFDSDISSDTLHEAIGICFQCSDDFSRLFRILPEFVRDAEKLSQWFGQLNNVRYVKKNRILQIGPGCVRKKSKLDAALEYLALNRHLQVVQYKKTQCIDLFPHYQPDFQQLHYEVTSCAPSIYT